MSLFAFIAITFSALLGAVTIIVLLGMQRRKTAFPRTQKDLVLLYRDGVLVDTTPDADVLFGFDAKKLGDLTDLLTEGFPELHPLTQQTGDWDHILHGLDDCNITLHASARRATLRLAFSGDTRHWQLPIERKTHARAALMQDIAACSPQVVWQEDLEGRLTWSNQLFDTLAQTNDAFPFAAIARDPAHDGPLEQRLCLLDDDDRWFDVVTVRRGQRLLHFANDATALVRADKDSRAFVQTLGKTFADLSIGLAIFNKGRELVMFNPALLDMTKLPVTFLSGRPTVDTFLDRLRELQMMPEPKDYTSWRDQFIAVEAASKDGTYCENWALPDGQTYRVTGRPHPDGAFAMLFEDITAEVSLTRRFRSDIETSQAVLDSLPDAIAVFSGTGTMVISNASYGNLWSIDPTVYLEHRDVRTEVGTWQDRCIATPMWTEMRDFIQRLGARKPWSEHAMLDDGRHLRCHAIPIAGGMTMVRFVIAPPMRPVIQKLTQVDHAILSTKA